MSPNDLLDAPVDSVLEPGTTLAENDSPPPEDEAAKDPLVLEAAKREYRLLKRLLLIALGINCAIAVALDHVDPDLWGHVTYGQELLATGELPRTATHTYTATHYPWINHENLAEITLALTYQWLGVPGLLVGKCLLGIAILAAMAWVAHRQQVPHILLALFLLLLAHNLTAFIVVRPQLLSFAWFTLLLLILHHAFVGWHNTIACHRQEKKSTRSTASSEQASSWTFSRLTWLLLALPIVVLWTNSHGAFAAGVAILCTYLVGRAIEALYYRRTEGLAIAALLLLVAGLAGAATLLNPYGLELHQWMRMALGSPRPEISEWQPLKTVHPNFWPGVMLAAVSVVSMLFTRRRRDWVQIVVLALVGWQAVSHLRHIALFTLLAGFWLPVHVHSVMQRLHPPTLHKLPVMRIDRRIRWGLASLLVMAIGIESWALAKRLDDLPVQRGRWPVDALQWMAYHHLDGKLVVNFNWAQYVIAALGPEIQVSFDGRFRTCYPQEIIDLNFDFMLGENAGKRYRRPGAGKMDPEAILNYRHPNLVLLDRQYSIQAATMRDLPNNDWILLYQDRVAQLWGLRSRYGDPASSDYINPHERIVSEHLSLTSLNWPALPNDTPPAAFKELQQVAAAAATP